MVGAGSTSFLVDWHAITQRIPKCKNQSCNWKSNYENTKFVRDHIGEFQKINVSSWTEELKGVNSRGGWVGL